jgi:hypothetical protein
MLEEEMTENGHFEGSTFFSLFYDLRRGALVPGCQEGSIAATSFSHTFGGCNTEERIG